MLILVPTPIGNIEDITLRAIKALERADIFLCEDTRVAKKLLNLLKKRLDISFKSSKFYSFHEHNQNIFLSKIEPTFFEQNVVYITDAGMPSISDPGVKLIKYCQKHSIEYDVLPGASALIVAYVASGYEGEFTFFGFLPHSGSKRKKSLIEVLNHPFNSILFEAPHRLLKLLEEINSIDSDREIFLAKELTKKYQKYYKDKVFNLLNILKDEDIKGEWVVVIPNKDQFVRSHIDIEDILSLDIPKKQKAKLLSKITNKDIKYWYEKLIDSD